MATPNQNSPERLREEILVAARREGDEIVRQARAAATALLAQGTKEADQARQERIEQASVEAARQTDLVLATVPVEAGRARSARVEALLGGVCEDVRRRLQAPAGLDYRETLTHLAAEAISRMSGEDFELKLAPGDPVALGDGLVAAITSRAGRAPLRIRLSEDPAITGGGLVIQDAEGRQVWDNRLEARLQRLWPELRRQIAIETSLLVASGATGGGGA
jgi:vacuolar-type H+-ATPase subunit E/Vma4